ncbi:Ig-like domain-containing protein [Staphylococcus felis]|uniref:Ig-like domain-containing protein n=1 Tax=Staphylococcus felis TaxID=46127 RepID=UPI0021D10BE5|nr:Ig-like domain-containing protein [Staphylococcus felis]UXR87150.1 Ig-like domain-containing protein [Staphylococcus felis]
MNSLENSDATAIEEESTEEETSLQDDVATSTEEDSDEAVQPAEEPVVNSDSNEVEAIDSSINKETVEMTEENTPSQSNSIDNETVQTPPADTENTIKEDAPEVTKSLGTDEETAHVNKENNNNAVLIDSVVDSETAVTYLSKSNNISKEKATQIVNSLGVDLENVTPKALQKAIVDALANEQSKYDVQASTAAIRKKNALTNSFVTGTTRFFVAVQPKQDLPQNETYQPHAKQVPTHYRYGQVGVAKEAIANLNVLPKDARYSWKDNSVFQKVGNQLATIVVTYADDTVDEVKAPIFVAYGYEEDGEKYSGVAYSAENKFETTNADVFIAPRTEDLTSDEARQENTIDFSLSTVYNLNRVTSGMTTYIELDERIAKYVTKITGNIGQVDAGAKPNRPFEWERVRNAKGELTNTWKHRTFNALGYSDKQTSVFLGDSPAVSQVSASQIHLEDSIRNLMNEDTLLQNGDLTFRTYTTNKDGQIILNTDRNNYFQVADEAKDELVEGTNLTERNWFNDSGTITHFEPQAGPNGGIVFDQYINKDSRGTLNGYGAQPNKNWEYRFEIDPRLLKYVDDVEIHYIKEDGKSWEVSESLKNRFDNESNALGGTKREGWNDFEYRFNNGDKIESTYTGNPTDGGPQTGISGTRGPVAWFDTREQSQDKPNGYKHQDSELKPGQGYFTLDSVGSNVDARQLNFKSGLIDPARVRVVAKLKDGITLNDVLGENRDENFAFRGYLVNKNNEIIPSSAGSGFYQALDVDGDGVADEIDNEIVIPDPPTPIADNFTPQGQGIETNVGEVPDPKSGITNINELPANATYHWEVVPNVSVPTEEGNPIEANVIVTYEDGSQDKVAVPITVKDIPNEAPTITPIEDKTVVEGQPIEAIPVTTTDDSGEKPTVKVEGLPPGLTYNTETGVIEGTPEVPDWRDDLPNKDFEEERDYTVTVTSTDGDGATTTEDFTIKVQRDTDKDGNPDVKDTDDDGDGVPDQDELDNGKNPKDGTDQNNTPPTITPIEDKTVVEGQPIEAIPVTTTDDSGEKPTVKVEGLPPGLTYNTETGVIEGTPEVPDWRDDLPNKDFEEERDYTVTVTSTDGDGATTTEDFTIKVQRDTDKDGNPDVKDTDDDGDGVPDQDELDNGKNPKDGTDQNNTPPTITPIENKTVVEGQPIEAIPVTTTDDSGEKPTVKVEGLPPGLTYNTEAGVIEGTPEVPDWRDDLPNKDFEEERDYTVTVTSTDGDGATMTEDFTIKVQRDTDKDGNPDVKDTDDDGDGVPDQDELDKGTNPKDSSDTPDVVAPDAPKVNNPQPGDKEVTGTGEPGTTVVVTFPNGETGTGKVDEKGNWSVSVPPTEVLEEGEVITVVNKDNNGNTSEPGTGTVTDTIAPDAPKVNNPQPGDKEVTGTGEPGTTVVVTFPNGETGTGKVDEKGNWSVSVPPTEVLEEGEIITVVNKDNNGNTSEPGTGTVTDTIAPDAPKVNNPQPGDKEVTGTGEPGTTVVVTFPNGETGTGKVDEKGNWSVPVPPTEVLEEGEIITVVNKDNNGNTSEPGTGTVTDTIAPDAPKVNNPQPGDKEVTGTGEPGTTVVVTFPNGETGTGKVDEKGNWSVSVPPTEVLEEGEVITVVNKDNNGNTSEPGTGTVTDTIAPDAPKVNNPQPGDKEVTGTGEPGTTVVVTFPNGETGTGKVDEKGNWSVSVPPTEVLEEGEIITVVNKDNNGNTSEPGTGTVTDTIAPDAPKVNNPQPGDKEVTGTGEPGTTVVVTFPNGETGTGKVDEKGNWSVPVPPTEVLEEGEIITVVNKDNNGNTSEPGTGIVTSDKTVTGKGEPGETVLVTLPSGDVVPCEVDENGNWLVNIPMNEKVNVGDMIAVKDHKGNMSKSKVEMLPETGSNGENHTALFGGLMAGLGSLFLIGRRRRNQEEK